MTRTLTAAALALLLTASAAHAQTMNAAQPDQPHASAADTAKHAGTVVVDKTKQAVHATSKAAKKVVTMKEKKAKEQQNAECA